jgi:hypothetical protein
VDVTTRRVAEPEGAMRLYAPCTLQTSLADGIYEMQLTVSGDPEGAPRLRVLNDGVQILADYCLAGGELRETITFLARATSGKLHLDLIPGQNYATGSLFPAKGFVGSYGAWWSPRGNYTRVQDIRVVRRVEDQSIRWPTAEALPAALPMAATLRVAGDSATRSVAAMKSDVGSCAPASARIRFGWLLPGASSECAFGGLVVDHEDADEGSPTTMKWRAGGFRVELTHGRYNCTVRHSSYAKMGTVFVDIFANGQKVVDSLEVDQTTTQFTACTVNGTIELTWRQPRVHSRVPRYAIQAIVFERID